MLPYFINPLSANPTKLSNTLKQFVGSFPTNCLSVFDHFIKLAFKGLNLRLRNTTIYIFRAFFGFSNFKPPPALFRSPFYSTLNFEKPLHTNQYSKINSIFSKISNWSARSDGQLTWLVLWWQSLNFFDECAVKCLHLFFQEKESISSSWGDSKMYKPDIIANSQTTPTEIKMVLLPKQKL